jgi:Fur family ferric uptake transcriptional regulator
MEEIEAILKKHGLRTTKFRMTVVQLFQEHGQSFTADEIKSKLGTGTDKVTVYRTLKAFEEAKLIHIVPDKSNFLRYALSENQDKDKHPKHAHFVCNSCKDTFCMDGISVPTIKQDKGFKVLSATLTYYGVCGPCSR